MHRNNPRKITKLPQILEPIPIMEVRLQRNDRRLHQPQRNQLFPRKRIMFNCKKDHSTHKGDKMHIPPKQTLQTRYLSSKEQIHRVINQRPQISNSENRSRVSYNHTQNQYKPKANTNKPIRQKLKDKMIDPLAERFCLLNIQPLLPSIIIKHPPPK